jgi:hypothetical protein
MTGAPPVAVWQELIRPNPNVFMVLSGHVTDAEHRRRDRLTDAVLSGTSPTTVNTVHEVLTDYQSEQGLEAAHLSPFTRLRKHGNGWLRRMIFRPALNRVDVRAHSVLGATQLRLPQYGSVSTAAPHTFSFRYLMNAPVPTVGAPPSDRFTDRAVNADATRDQRAPRVAHMAGGDWVGVWEDDSHGAEGVFQIHARGFNATGCQKWGRVVVNTTSAGQQINPAVAANGSGFVAVWQDSSSAANRFDIRMRGFDAAGNGWPVERPVNTSSSGRQVNPAIAMNASGDFVVVWEDDTDGNGKYQIKVRGFDASGNERFAQRTVNDTAKGQQRRPSVAMRQNGAFVVTWEDDGGDGIYEIKARGFSASGGITGPGTFTQRTVNASSDGQQRRPVIGMASNGNFVVAFEDNGGDEWYQVKMRGFRADGSPRFSHTVNTSSTGQQRRPGIAMHEDGRFVVTWEDSGDDDVYQIKARAFRSDGTQLWSARTVNTLKAGQQRAPAISVASSGQFVVAWEDDLERNGRWEILARGCSLANKCAY